MSNTARRLPLWSALLEKITEDGIGHGTSFDAEFFEQELSCKRDSREFGLAVHKIRVALERSGFYLQGHAIRDGKLVIVPPEKNIVIAKLRERRIHRDRGRSIALLASTDRALLPAKIKAPHEKMLMRIQIKQLIEKRAGRIHKYLTKKAPQLLMGKM